jgi:D-glycero-alpha-D-manno-heptose 1-phosphate guanylyltransferase
MEAIILAGGLGTRLKNVVYDVPKVMAPINNIPFLEYLLNYLLKNNIDHFILAVGYKYQIIQNHFGNSFKGIPISYSIEKTPLKTGGAIKKALTKCKTQEVFILNGDTYYNVNLNAMKKFHLEKQSLLTVAIKSMSNCKRYGSVTIKNDKIIEFNEKKNVSFSKINGGIYLINSIILNNLDKISFSFESEILKNKLFDIYAFESNEYFIDIGVPEDYFKAKVDFKNKGSIIYE